MSKGGDVSKFLVSWADARFYALGVSGAAPFLSFNAYGVSMTSAV